MQVVTCISSTPQNAYPAGPGSFSAGRRRQPAIHAWLARGATAWREALSPLTPAERRTFVATLLAYEKGIEGADDQR